MEFIFKKATLEQKEELFELYSLVMKDLIEKIWGWDQKWQEEDFSSHFVPRNITVACENQKIVGYLQSENKGQAKFVRMLLVHPKHQKKGIGGKFLQTLINESRNEFKTINLEVFKVNSRVLQFYKRAGFEINGETPHSFIMEKNA